FRVFILYFANTATQGTIYFYLCAFFHLYLFNVNWFDDPARGHFAFITLYFLIDSIFYSLLVVSQASWFRRAFLIIALTSVNIFFVQIGILVLKSNWVLWLILSVQLGELFILAYLRK